MANLNGVDLTKNVIQAAIPTPSGKILSNG